MTPIRIAVIGAGHLGKIHTRLLAGDDDEPALVDQSLRERLRRRVAETESGQDVRAWEWGARHWAGSIARAAYWKSARILRVKVVQASFEMTLARCRR